MDTGEKIHRLRTEKKLTLEELGNMVGVGKSTVRKWENGIIANMKRDKILKVSEALGTSPTYLMGWKDKDELQCAEETIADAQCDLISQCGDAAKAAVGMFVRLDDIDRGKVLGRMEAMLDGEKYKKGGGDE